MPHLNQSFYYLFIFYLYGQTPRAESTQVLVLDVALKP